LQKFVTEEQIKGWKSAPGVEAMMKSTEQGAATTVIAAVGKEFEGRGRLFLEDAEESTLTQSDNALAGHGFAKYAFDKENEKQLWEDSLKLVRL
jgi:hypothetical protein